MNFTAKPLAGCSIGVSISETEEIEDLGYKKDEINRCTVRLCEALLGAGASLVFGHDWRPGGVMEAITDLAIRHSRINSRETAAISAPITNLVAAPDTPFLAKPDLMTGGANRYAPLLRGVIDARQVVSPGSQDRLASLSIMRRELASLCNIRICIGGRLRNFAGRMPGIIEEALYTSRHRRPTFSSAVFGGASGILAASLYDNALKLEESFAKEVAEIAEVQRFFFTDDYAQLACADSVESCVESALRCAVTSWRLGLGR